MTAAPLTEGQLRAQVTAVRAKLPKVRFIGIHAPAWTGPSRLRLPDGDVEVAWCVSALAMSERMAEAPADGPPLVLVTDRTDADLGTDLLVRLAKRGLFTIDAWRVVLDLFQARQIDPIVAQERWMADALLESAPPGGYPAVATGILDADTAWSTLLRRFSIGVARPDDDLLLRWTVTDGAALLMRAPAAVREGIVAWLAKHAGPIGAAILAAARAGRVGDAAAIGLVARVVFGASSDDNRLVEAAVRLEPFCGGASIADTDGRRWADLAEAIIRENIAQAGPDSAWTNRAESILHEVRATDFAWRSPVLRRGFEQRLERLGRAVLRVLEGSGQPSEAAAAADLVREHALAQSEEDRVQTAAMADRLVRWLAHVAERPAPTCFAEAVATYRDDDAWADRARTILRAGDRVPALAEACRRLGERVLAAREDANRRFAQLLAAYTSAGTRDQRIVPVEDVVARVVAPLASKQPVLLLVLDGMSAAVCQNLVEDLATDWLEIIPVGHAERQVALSALPSVTEISRTSLFSGAIRRGGSSDEAREFAAHADLRAVTRSGHPSVVFHKADLTEAGQALADDVRTAILSQSQQVVAVVVNAIDDHLDKGDQIPVRWSRATIRPLPLLLDAARQAGRAVVLTSDHGHIDDDGVQLRRQDGGGSRWRPVPSGGAITEDEVLLEGPRVLGGNSARVVALATERIRYGTKHSGYHGGATAQEVVVPLVVLNPATRELPAGWVELAVQPPSWWENDAVGVPARMLASASPTPVEPPPTTTVSSSANKAQLDLLAPPSDVAPWIRQLLASPAYVAQRKRSERGAATDDQVTRVIGALDRRGGTMTRAALARALDLPPVRLATVLAAVRRLLNIEGYPVLAVDETADTVVLDRAMLATQFDLHPGKP